MNGTANRDFQSASLLFMSIYHNNQSAIWLLKSSIFCAGGKQMKNCNHPTEENKLGTCSLQTQFCQVLKISEVAGCDIEKWFQCGQARA